MCLLAHCYSELLANLYRIKSASHGKLGNLVTVKLSWKKQVRTEGRVLQGEKCMAAGTK